MLRRVFCRGLTGFMAGVAVDYIAAIVTSFILKLGYFMPCLAFLPEQVGGEMNAVLLQAMICGLTGAAIGMATAVLRMSRRKADKAILPLHS